MPPPNEPTLLTRYLLPPSSLPTIIPYTQFLSLLPSSLRSTATTSPHSPTAILLKRLYQDLQFQRDIDVDTVAQNIQRECARSEILRGRLEKEVREELGIGERDRHQGNNGREGETKGKGKKRKRPETEDHSDEEAYEDEDSMSEQDQRSLLEDSTTFTENNTNNHPPSSKPPMTTKIHDPLLSPLEPLIDCLFSGPRGLANPTSKQRYHTPSSLIQHMQSSLTDLTREIAELNNQSEKILGEMRETVGGMSDLRYGRFARVSGGTRQSNGEGVEDGTDAGGEGGLEEQVTEALRELKQVVERKTKAEVKRKENARGKG